MKYTDREWAIVNDKTGEIYLSPKFNNKVITFCTRDEARDEKASLEYGPLGKVGARDYRVERVKVTYERIQVS